MHTTRIIRNINVGWIRSCPQGQSRVLRWMPVLALCMAASAWGQTFTISNGPHRLPKTPVAAPSANFEVSTPDNGHYKFITIDTPDSPYAVAGGINDSRVVTGYYQDSSLNYHGFVWQKGTLQTVDYPGAVNTLLGGVNNLGLAMGGYGDGTTNHTVIYSVSTDTWSALPDIPNYSQNDGYCINDAGFAIGNAFEGSTSVAWIWDPSKRSYSFFVVPGAKQYSTSPSCINDKNQVAGYYADASGNYHGFIKEYGTTTRVNVPKAPDTYPDGMNNGGIIQGQIFNASFMAEGWVGTPGGVFTIVNYPGAKATAIVGINDRGDLCGAYGPAPAVAQKAFVAILQR
jgi:hypothetical protein